MISAIQSVQNLYSSSSAPKSALTPQFSLARHAFADGGAAASVGSSAGTLKPDSAASAASKTANRFEQAAFMNRLLASVADSSDLSPLSDKLASAVPPAGSEIAGKPGSASASGALKADSPAAEAALKAAPATGAPSATAGPGALRVATAGSADAGRSAVEERMDYMSNPLHDLPAQVLATIAGNPAYASAASAMYLGAAIFRTKPVSAETLPDPRRAVQEPYAVPRVSAIA